MRNRLLPVLLWLTLTGAAAAKMCCYCCCTAPCSEACAPARVEMLAENTCDDVRPAPTCRSLKPSLCRPLLANAVLPDDRLEIYQSEGLRQIPEIWEKTWKLEMPDIATPYQSHGKKL